MTRKLKVYSGSLDGRSYAAVAATGWMAAFEVIKKSGKYWGSYATWRRYFSETGNPDTIEAAMSAPGELFVAPIRPVMTKQWTKCPRGR